MHPHRTASERGHQLGLRLTGITWSPAPRGPRQKLGLSPLLLFILSSQWLLFLVVSPNSTPLLPARQGRSWKSCITCFWGAVWPLQFPIFTCLFPLCLFFSPSSSSPENQQPATYKVLCVSMCEIQRRAAWKWGLVLSRDSYQIHREIKWNQTSVLQKKKKKVWKDRCALICTLGQTKAGQSQDYMVRISK